MKEVKDEVEKLIKELKEQTIQPGNVDYLYKLVDIHKDLSNEEYWEKEKEMRYRGNYSEGYGNYGEYGETYGRRGVPGTGRRYRESYGRRGVDAKYRGEEMLNDMSEEYENYMESGNYGGEDTMKALKYMLKSAEEFFKHIQEEAQSPEEIELVKQSARKISEM